MPTDTDRTEYQAWQDFRARQDDPDAIDEAREMGHVPKREEDRRE